MYKNDGIPFIRIENIKGGFFIDDTDLICISESDHLKLSNSILKTNDIILSKVGNSIGYFSRVSSKINECNISENNIGIKLRAQSDYKKHYILTYLNSSYAQALVLRRRSGNAQPKLNVRDLTYIPIPTFSEKFEKTISNIIIEANRFLESSISFFEQAEKTLMNHIGFGSIVRSESSITIKSFKQTYATCKRLDAEYYQSKYDIIIDKISQYPVGKDKIGNLFLIKDENFHPDYDTQYKYIELSDIGLNGSISGCTYDYGSNLPSRARRIVHKGDIIVPSVEGSLSSCAIIPAEYDGALCSTGFFVLSPQKINAETSLVLFKNRAIQLLLARACTGTILTAMNKDDFKAINLPLINEDTQIKIADLIKQRYSSLLESKRLLNLAKSAVETAIEQGEDVALNILKQNKTNIYENN